MISTAFALPLDRPVATADSAPAMDEAAFRRLYEGTARPLRGYLVRSCGNAALADDLLQESYLRLLRSGFDARDDDHRRRYLYRIATNLLRDHYRRARPTTDRVPDIGHEPEHDTAVHLRSDVGSAMADIGRRDRQMLWLAYVEGASHEEIAEIMGLKAASIRSMLFRARNRLAEQLRARGLQPGVVDR